VRDQPTIDEETTAEAGFTDTAGARQVVGFYGPPGHRTFGVLHLPAAEPAAGIVICPALHSDFERTYRIDVLLGRALSAQGYAVHRFHYRGHGNSEEAPSETTFDTMREDAVLASERLRRIAGVRTVAFAGMRWGALVATAAATREEGAPLVLWEPTMHAAKYFREAGRARAVRDAQQGRSPTSWQTLLEDLHRAGSIDVLGYAITADLYDSAATVTLSDLLGDSPRPVLLMQMGGDGKISTAYERAVSDWGAKGFAVEARSVDKEEGWWFVGDAWEAIEARNSTRQLIDQTTEWITRWLPNNGS
jgi:pimeloyl-ACP methyl ester carboxylesterase